MSTYKEIENFPFISVIIPAYNAEKTVGACIKSLMSQDYPKERYEIIVVDNDSTDSTLKLIREYPITCLVEKKTRSSYAARNLGIKHSKGEILAFSDADCIADNDWLSKGREIFLKQEIGCVGGLIISCGELNFANHSFQCFNISRGLVAHLFLPYAQTANIFFRREVFGKIGPFEGRWISSADIDMCWRMQLQTQYKIDFAPQARVSHRHCESITELGKKQFRYGIGYSFLNRKHSLEPPVAYIIYVALLCFKLFCLIKLILFLSTARHIKYSQKKCEKYIKTYCSHCFSLGKAVGYIFWNP